MRILVVSDLFPPVAFGGYDLECAALVERLRDHHDVVVLTSDLRRDHAPADPGVLRVLPFLGAGRRRAVVGAPSAAVRAAQTTRRVVEDVRPELVYVSSGLAIPQAAIAIAGSSGAPLVCRFSELWFAGTFLSGDRFLRHLRGGESGARAAWGAVARAVNRHPALRLVARPHLPAAISWASEALRQAAGTPPCLEPTLERVIHPATERNVYFAKLERRPAPTTAIAYVGRVTTAKGAEVACRALCALRDRHGVRARLIFAGHCALPMRRRLLELARGLDLDGDVVLAGALDRDALGAVLACAHAIVVPTVAFEAFSLVCVEAALARAPVVASRIGGIPEVLTDGDHALLFTTGDPEACATALATTLSDGAATAARVTRAFERAHRFTLDSYLDASEGLIADAV